MTKTLTIKYAETSLSHDLLVDVFLDEVKIGAIYELGEELAETHLELRSSCCLALTTVAENTCIICNKKVSGRPNIHYQDLNSDLIAVWLSETCDPFTAQIEGAQISLTIQELFLKAHELQTETLKQNNTVALFPAASYHDKEWQDLLAKHCITIETLEENNAS